MSEEPSESPSTGLGRYAVIVRRHKWAVLVLTLLGLLGGLGYLQLKPPTHTATTLVALNVISSEPFNSQRPGSGLLDAQTEQQTARSTPVLSAAATALGSDDSAADLGGVTTATLLPDATIVRITFSAPTEARAVAGADAVAEAYLEFRTTQAEDKRTVIVDQLSTRRDALRREATRVNAALAKAAAGSPEQARAQADQQVLSLELQSLATELNGLSGLDTTGGVVLSPAADNPVALSPRPGLVLATGLGAGFVLGLIAAFVINGLDRRVRDEYDVVGAGAGRVFAAVGGRTGLVPADGPDRDAIDAARERLLAEFNPAGGVLALLDLTRGRQPSDLGINLTIALAEAHSPVVLILPEWPGECVDGVLRALGTQRAAASRGVVQIPGQSLRVLIGPDQHKHARSNWMSMLRDATAEPDPGRCLVIVVPPRASRALRLAAGRLSDSTLLVAEILATHIGDLARQATEMQAVHTVVRGTLLAGHRRRTEYALSDLVPEPSPGARTEAEAGDGDGDGDLMLNAIGEEESTSGSQRPWLKTRPARS